MSDFLDYFTSILYFSHKWATTWGGRILALGETDCERR